MKTNPCIVVHLRDTNNPRAIPVNRIIDAGIEPDGSVAIRYRVPETDEEVFTVRVRESVPHVVRMINRL